VTTNARLEQALRRVLWTLRPYLSDVVVIGGWVPHLYRRHGGFAEWRSGLSGTAEVDVLLPASAPAAERPPLGEILTSAGFRSSNGGAVWENDPATGEKVEFFVPHTGIAASQGVVRPVADQSGVGAFALTDLDVLSEHTRILPVPMTVQEGPPVELSVRVPTLGAYLVAKACTFLKRSPIMDGTMSRRAKDLVYIRDVMAAGEEVVRRVEADVIEMRHRAGGDRRLEYAVSQLALLNDRHPALVEAAQELAERDLVPESQARSDVLGHVHDLHDLLI
jgi:hypothetical protein